MHDAPAEPQTSFKDALLQPRENDDAPLALIIFLATTAPLVLIVEHVLRLAATSRVDAW